MVIQQRALQPIIKGCDVIAQAQSGTGQIVNIDTREIQVLILSPTHNLAPQIQKVFLTFGDYMNVLCHACYGGTNVGQDIRQLQYGQHIVLGPLGLVKAMIEGQHLRTSMIKILRFWMKQIRCLIKA